MKNCSHFINNIQHIADLVAPVSLQYRPDKTEEKTDAERTQGQTSKKNPGIRSNVSNKVHF